MQPRPFHGGFLGKPRTLSLFPLLFSLARNTYPAIPVPLGSINHIVTITGPRPTHGGYPPPALHQLEPTLITHKLITVHTRLALSKEEGEGGARAPHHNYYRQHIHPYSNH